MAAVPAQEINTRDHLITITVNEKPVRIDGPQATGLKIKQAAIDAGVQIELSFLLSEELPNHHTRIVGDTDEVRLNKHSRFTAVADDDNS
ncbi:multiubiquitin domain-containing protein [Micromonospora sp. RTP1Z1]|uniref:multiubiquitin domain-containing protein n=1 Tax=Micromonospora sp. RTP1Z1 TaxID=2994043 RepID=UPI0029C80A9E|nr:multiubiquitin domain-containing protein [Micromonospora sp. RTP1Z1]